MRTTIITERELLKIRNVCETLAERYGNGACVTDTNDELDTLEADNNEARDILCNLVEDIELESQKSKEAGERDYFDEDLDVTIGVTLGGLKKVDANISITPTIELQEARKIVREWLNEAKKRRNRIMPIRSHPSNRDDNGLADDEY